MDERTAESKILTRKKPQGAAQDVNRQRNSL
jgi:hypothetical protein